MNVWLPEVCRTLADNISSMHFLNFGSLADAKAHFIPQFHSMATMTSARTIHKETDIRTERE